MQQSRFELKFLIDEAVASRVRDFVRCYLAMDEYGVGRPDYAYPVHSLYLDSDDLQIYWRTVNGEKNRYKLRLRYYSDQPDSPVFFEVKRRMKDVILKQRGGVRQDAVPRLLAGQLPDPSEVLTRDAKSLAAVHRFQELMLSINAKPKSHIFYRRVTAMGHRKLAAHAAVLEEESLLSSCRPGDDLPDFVRQDTGIPRQVSGR